MRALTSIVGLLIVVTVAGPARADDPPSFRERQWGEGLARALGQPSAQVRPATAAGATGISIELEGLSARRFRFDDPEAALSYTRGGLGKARGLALVEVRGAQVLLLRGPLLADVVKTAKAREAGWLVLRCPQDEPDLLAFCKDGEVAASGPASAGAARDRESALVVSYLGLVGRAAPRRRPVGYEMQLASGQTADHALPALDDGAFWYVVAVGPEGGDVDLRIASSERSWLSASPGHVEDLLVAGDRPLKASVRNTGGAAGAARLLCIPLAPADTLGTQRLAAALEGQDFPVQLHAVEPSSSWTTVHIASPRADLKVVLHDAALRELAMAELEKDGLRVLVLPPGEETRWLCVSGSMSSSESGAYAIERRPITITDDLGAQAARGLVSGPDAWFRLRPPAGILVVRLAPIGPEQGKDLDLAVHGPDGSKRQAVTPDATEDVAINARANAEYLVRVRVGTRGAGGPFSLAAESLDVDRLAPDGAGGPRTWALMIGVAAYREVANTVNFTRGDALALYDALRDTGALEPERAIVLIDERARAETVRRALSAIVRRADQDDTILLFFAGHGTRALPDAAPVDEKDGHDEGLVCFDKDGVVTDDDLRALLEPARAAQVAIVVNACHSGGLSELIDRPGRFGLFSSLESELSTESSLMEAGALTSAFLTALRGAGDLDHDGVVGLREAGRWTEQRILVSCVVCGARVFPRDRACGSCRLDLTEPNNRQTPVLVDRLRVELPLGRSR
jgi:hypothetical protein